VEEKGVKKPVVIIWNRYGRTYNEKFKATVLAFIPDAYFFPGGYNDYLEFTEDPKRSLES